MEEPLLLFPEELAGEFLKIDMGRLCSEESSEAPADIPAVDEEQAEENPAEVELADKDERYVNAVVDSVATELESSLPTVGFLRMPLGT